MRDYREKQVQGVMWQGLTFTQCPVDVRMTSDKHGQTLSLTGNGVQIAIPLEDVKDIITIARRRDEKRNDH